MEEFAYEPLEAREVVRSAAPTEFGADALRRAQADASRAADDARARGYDDGYRSGLAEAQAQLGPAVEALASALEETHRTAHELADATERRAVELAVAIAEKVVAASLEVRPEIVLDAVGGALRRVSTPEQLTLAVNPDDAELVRESIGKFAERLAGLDRLEVIGERRIARGGCVLHTVDGDIDGQVGEQLARAAEVLRENLRSAHERVDG